MEMDGADDGIRTRDPNLGKAKQGVRLTAPRALTCASVQPVVRQDGGFPPCGRPRYTTTSNDTVRSAILARIRRLSSVLGLVGAARSELPSGVHARVIALRHDLL